MGAGSIVGKKGFPVVSISLPLHSQYPDSQNDIQHVNALLKQIQEMVVKYHGDVQFTWHPLPLPYNPIA